MVLGAAGQPLRARALQHFFQISGDLVKNPVSVRVCCNGRPGCETGRLRQQVGTWCAMQAVAGPPKNSKWPAACLSRRWLRADKQSAKGGQEVIIEKPLLHTATPAGAATRCALLGGAATIATTRPTPKYRTTRAISCCCWFRQQSAPIQPSTHSPLITSTGVK